jgi:CDP-diacylglycerol--serine O-phosphatidyltransferase
VPFVSLFAVVLIFVTIALDPPTVLFMMASTFAVSGPLMTVIGLRHRSRQKEKRQEEGGNPPS